MFQQLKSPSMHTYVRRLSKCLIALAAMLFTVAAPFAHAQSCNVVYTISPQNTSAFGAAITIQNTGTTVLSSWTLTWSFANGQTVAQLWNGIETQSGANVTVKNEPYNGSIPVGGSVTGIGFNGTWNGATNAVPTNFAINGTACGGDGQGNFTLAPSAPTLSIAPGSSATDTITVTDVSPFTGSVSFATSGLPTGVTASFSPTSSASSSVVTFAVAATTLAGTYPITITGTSGTLTPVTTTITLTVTGQPSFTIGPGGSLTIPQCGSGSLAIPVTGINGFTGSITLSASGLPTGLTVGFGTNPITGGSSILTFTASCSIPVGTYPITVIGTSGTLTKTTTITITITAAGGFTLTPSALALSILPGASGTDTITVNDVSPFAGSVLFAASGLPSGVTASFSPASSASSSVVTFTAAATAVAGTYPVTITGTSGTLSATTSIALTVGTIATGACQVIYTISPQNSTSFGAAITIDNTSTTALSSWTLTWSFANGQTVASMWNGVEAQSGANVTVENESYNGSIPANGSVTGIGFNGTWNGVTNAVPTNFAINGTACGGVGQGNFTLKPSAATLSVAPGTSGTDTITVTDVSPFTGSVTFAASGLPTGVTASFSPASSTTSSVVTFTVAATTLAGTYPITITGTSGTLTPVTTSISLTVTSPPSFTIGPINPPPTIPQCGSGPIIVPVTYVGGFTGSVALSASGLPAGVTAAFNPNSVTTSGNVTITLAVGCSVTPGTYTITITATSGTVTRTTTVSFTITPNTPGFALSALPATVTVAPGGTGTSTITVTDEGGFTGPVTLAVSGQPTGVVVAIATNPATATSVLTFTAASTVANGTFTITITGTSGTLTPATTTISLTVGTGLASTFKGYFIQMHDNDITQANGYFSPLGIPYHSVETMIIEAPDYGHETVSETYSYYLWLESLYGAVTGTWTPLQTAWNSYQTYMIPSAAEQPTNAGYKPSSPATYAPTGDSPSDYPSTLTSSVTTGIDPIAAELNTTYGTPNIYGAHWIIDTSNWYGYGINEDGIGTPSCINTYQRGPQESVWLTVPQPCWDNFKYGNASSGYLSLYTSGPWTQQWKYTDAPDADARAIQAMYWAQQYSNGNSTVAALLPNAAELGDYLRYSFFDKYFKAQGCQSLSCPVENGTKNSSAYLLAWYYAWGGALPADGSWAWRIGSSDVHFGYQNPLAAYALSTDSALTPKSPTAKADWTTTLSRMIQFYRWLQSSQGAIAGGATNSWGGGSNNAETAWGGQYAAPPTGTSTFYGMSYIAEPSYDNPPSNQWFGFQAWSMERVAEYYYATGNADAKIVLDPWIVWAEANTTATATIYSVPSSLSWTGQPSLNWSATNQDWTVGDLGVSYNSGLSVTITASGQDVGVTGSLCKALLYYSAGTAKWAGAQDMPSFTLAQTLLQDIWTLNRDSIGVSTPETGTTYNQITTPIYIPSGWTGTMPNGDPINSNSTFLSIRTQYETDPEYPTVAAYAAGTGSAPVFRFHRFWAETDVATAYAVYYLLFPNN
jgi:hypothetical protein